MANDRPLSVVITGASDGIGAELARQWAARRGAGLAVVLAARDETRLQQVAAVCRAHGATAHVQRCDVGVQADCRALVDAALAACGRLDVLVNNAGRSAHARLDEVVDLGWYEDLMRVNLWGGVWTTRAALPALKASRGRVVAVSSVAGLVGVPGRTAYSATKFALNGFFESLRVELVEHGVGVTLAYPGVVATEIRRRGYGPDGRPAGKSGLDESKAMPVDVCARRLLDGIERGERDVFFDARTRLGRWLKLIAPGRVDRIALQALNRHAPGR
ncbi:SDR family oxidoreductase [Aquabacterium sp. J223]|uniref:SDR family oxidoreductase n=1 Tax=Aquabacterium sp. J223 TaxID=2898431 RepID=UPI0021AE0650|nr:SDR family oxidoreductase [Aquabacterium sp. J223]UUX95174.1 SDR family oxidoreductase [Aquabacterium sp. J223]